MKASVTAELLLLVGIAAVAYLLFVQQQQLAEFELELDRIRGAFGALAPAPEAAPKLAAEGAAAPAVSGDDARGGGASA